MTKTLEMVFRNQDGKEVTVRMADPKDDLTKAQVDPVMQDIIAKNVFTTNGGDLVQIVDARIRTGDAVSLA